MSIKLMSLAFDARVSNPLRKLVLLKLCDHANEKGQCWPSFSYIADQCEISRRSAISHVQALIEDGYLSSSSRFKNGEQTTNMYTVSIERLIKNIAEFAPPSANAALGVVQMATLGGATPAPRTTNEPSKGNTNKTIVPKNKFSDEDLKCAEWLAGKLKEFIPDCKSPNLNGWAKSVRDMRELDNRDHKEICQLWLWCRKDSFEAANVQSPEKLRKRYDQLKTKMKLPAVGGSYAGQSKPSLIDRFIATNYGSGSADDYGSMGSDDSVIRGEVVEPVRGDAGRIGAVAPDIIGDFKATGGGCFE